MSDLHGHQQDGNEQLGVAVPSTPLPRELAQFLASPALAPLFDAVAARLESNGHRASGQVSLDVDADGAHALSGILPRPVRAGRVTVRLVELDTALRMSPAQRGLVAVTAALRGDLANRPAQRAERDVARAALLGRLDAELAGAGLADAPWVPQWVEGMRRSGVLTRAGAGAQEEIVTAVAALGALARTSAPWLVGAEPAVDAHERWELGSLASHVGSDAHCLDGDRLASALVLRAAAVADDSSAPTNAASRRLAWERLGVAPDELSGTVLTWRLTGADDSDWAGMMRKRADLDLVTHLTVHELTGTAASVRLAEAGQVVFCCENPQVMQAAASAAVPAVLLCLSGNPSLAGLMLLDRLVRDGADVRYHGDFDWPGVAIASRIFNRGASPWRFGAPDYLAAVRAMEPAGALQLAGRVCATGWDMQLQAAMERHGVAVHEESLRASLLADLSSLTSPARFVPTSRADPTAAAFDAE